MRLPSRPLRLAPPRRPHALALGLLALAQVAAAAAFGLSVAHNGWLWFQGGDETYYHSTAWLLAQGLMPPASIGYGWSYLLSPVALGSGPDLLSALPAIVLLQLLVLLPLLVWAVHRMAEAIGGRAFAAAATFAWIVAPFVLIPFFDGRYHDKWVVQFLPQALGLTAMADFPSLLCVALSAVFCFRALDGDRRSDWLAAGLLAGFAIALKPSNALFLAGPALAFLAARRWRGAALAAAALVPSVVVLAVWKQRGLGSLPILSLGEARTAAGASAAALPPLAVSIGRYLPLQWGHLNENFLALREFTWSVRLVEALPLAGFVAVARRSVPKALLLGGWLTAFVLVKGSSEQASVESGSFFRLLLPAAPAYLLLAASIPLLVPGTLARLRIRPAAAPDAAGERRRLRALAAAGILLVALPLLLFAALPRTRGQEVVRDDASGVFVPVVDLGLRVSADGALRRLRWRPTDPAGVGGVFYRVWRLPAGGAVECEQAGAAQCTFRGGPATATTRAAEFVDRAPPGRWTYRVGVGANWADDPQFGDVFLLSAAARA